jgi:hypothetical protein
MHELQHVDDLYDSGFGKGCRGRPNGTAIVASDPWSTYYERRGYDAELACLKSKLEKCTPCDRCRKPIEKRIQDVISFRP